MFDYFLDVVMIISIAGASFVVTCCTLIGIINLTHRISWIRKRNLMLANGYKRYAVRSNLKTNTPMFYSWINDKINDRIDEEQAIAMGYYDLEMMIRKTIPRNLKRERVKQHKLHN